MTITTMSHGIVPSSGMHLRICSLVIALAIGFLRVVTPALFAAEPTDSIRWWVSTADLKEQLTEQPPLVWQVAGESSDEHMMVNPATTFQKMLGMGSSLEPSTCSNLWRMIPAVRERTIERLVSPTTGIGMNLMRICIGTPDFTGDAWYSYDDLPSGETDPELNRFSIEKDRAYILPVLKLARRKNPDLLFFASPWSPPGWMKSTSTMIGGHLLPRWYPAYAEYFVKFIWRGAVRIQSSESTRSLANVAFRNPDGQVVLVVVNTSVREQTFTINCYIQMATARLAGKAVATYMWQQP